MRIYALGVFCAVPLGFIVICLKNQSTNTVEITILSLFCYVLLLGGVSTPMLEVKAEIISLSLQFLNEPIVFKNQVLYFQSKSITDIISLLVGAGRIDMLITGLLIALFSVIFPIAKFIFSQRYLYMIAPGRWITFFALKSSKWSMADVFVVAIFIAYMGFDGLLSEQLHNLTETHSNILISTANGTSLQIGFFLFLGFCIGSLIVSEMLEKWDISRRTQ